MAEVFTVPITLICSIDFVKSLPVILSLRCCMILFVVCVLLSSCFWITSKGKIVPDMSAFEQAASLAKQFGGNFGNELAKATVAQLLGNGGNPEPDAE